MMYTYITGISKTCWEESYYWCVVWMVLVNSKLNLSQQCVPAAKNNHICPALPVRQWKGLSPSSALYDLTSSTAHSFVCARCKDTELSESMQRRTMKMRKGLEGKMCEEWLKSLCFLSPEKRN